MTTDSVFNFKNLIRSLYILLKVHPILLLQGYVMWFMPTSAEVIDRNEQRGLKWFWCPNLVGFFGSETCVLTLFWKIFQDNPPSHGWGGLHHSVESHIGWWTGRHRCCTGHVPSGGDRNKTNRSELPEADIPQRRSYALKDLQDWRS